METSNKDTVYYKGIQETHIKRISWPAIFAGTVIMLITLTLLSLLGVGIGLGSINPAKETNPFEGIGTGSLIWWVISNLLAVFAGAFVAANLTNAPYKLTGIYHGILSWSLYALILFWLMTTAVGGIMTGAGGAITKGLSAMGGGVSEITAMAGQGDTDRIKEMIQDALVQDQPAGAAKKEFDIDVMAVVQDVFVTNGTINTNDIQRADVEKSIARNSTLSKQDVTRATDVMLAKFQEAKQKWQEIKPEVEQTAQKATDTASKAAIWGFVALLLGVITAAAGGRMGKPDFDAIKDRRTTTTV